MAVKLHRCGFTWFKLQAHPCWKVQSALDEQGVAVRGRARARLFRGKRDELAAAVRPAPVPGDRVRGRLGLPRAVEGHGGDDPRRQARREARRRGRLDDEHGDALDGVVGVAADVPLGLGGLRRCRPRRGPAAEDVLAGRGVPLVAPAAPGPRRRGRRVQLGGAPVAPPSAETSTAATGARPGPRAALEHAPAGPEGALARREVGHARAGSSARAGTCGSSGVPSSFSSRRSR